MSFGISVCVCVCVCVCVVADVMQVSNWSLWWEALCFSISFPCCLLRATARFDCFHSVYIKLWMNSKNTINTVCPHLMTDFEWNLPDYDTHTHTYAYIYIYIYTRGGTVHVFVPSSHGMGISVRCVRSYNEYRQFTPSQEYGARSNATLFNNSLQNNNECELHTWKQSPLDSDHVQILNTSLTWTDKEVYFKGLHTQLFAKWIFVLVYPTSFIRHKSKYSITFSYLRCNISECETIIYYANDRLLLQSRFNGDTEVGALMFGSLYFNFINSAVKLAMLERMCVCVCVCARAMARSLQLFPYTSRINFKHLLSY